MKTLELAANRVVERPLSVVTDRKGGLYGFYPAEREMLRWRDGYIYIGKADHAALESCRKAGIPQE